MSYESLFSQCELVVGVLVRNHGSVKIIHFTGLRRIRNNNVSTEKVVIYHHVQ